MNHSVVCVVPPYYRLIESKNNRITPAIHYATQVLSNAGIKVTLVNGDYADENISYSDRYSIYCNSWLFKERYKSDLSVFEKTIDEVMKYDPSTVIISAGDVLIPTVEIGNAQSCAIIAEGIKRRNKNIRCIGYGHMLKYAESNLLNNLDFIITSECEDLLVDIVLGNNSALNCVNDHWLFDLDRLPILTTDNISQKIIKYDFDYIMSMRGCQYKCNFCLQSTMRNFTSTLSVENFKKNLIYRIKDIGLTNFYFADMVFLPKNDSRKEEMISMLIDIKKQYPSFKWCCEERTNNLIENDYLQFREAGCYHIKFGVEALEQKMLKTFGKKTSIENINKSFLYAKQAGLETTAYVLIGCPGFSDEDYKKMFPLFCNLQATNYVINISVPYCGTTLYQQVFNDLQRNGIYKNEEGLCHLSTEMPKVWGISIETIQKYFSLPRKKEDMIYRKYERKIVNPKIYFEENRIEYI